MDRKIFLKTISPLLLLPIIPINLLSSCTSSNNNKDLSDVIGRKSKEVSAIGNDKESGNSLYNFIEKKNESAKLLDFDVKADSIFYVIQSGVVQRVSLVVSSNILDEFSTHLTSSKWGKPLKTIKNDWGTNEEFVSNDGNLTVSLCNNNLSDGNQIIIESKLFKSYS